MFSPALTRALDGFDEAFCWEVNLVTDQVDATEQWSAVG